MVDLLLWLTNDTIIKVSAMGNRLATKGTRFRYNDCVASIVKFKSGMIGKITSNYGCVFPHFHMLNLYGTKATFLNDLKAGRLLTKRDKDSSIQLMKEKYPGVHKGDLIYSFVESIMKGKKAQVSADDIFKAMSVCFAIEKATQKSGHVKVNYI